ncbi:hypothetical protein [Halomonas sp.]|uniref:hypothetical protein n=1 Tax=Halomonas sp. TaxID=1486246 RepID=UPI0038602B27
MIWLLRSISIHAAMVAIPACFVVLIAAVAIMGQMDQITQQNASLVQEASAAAASLEEQVDRLERAVSVFRLTGTMESAPPAPQGTRA